MKTLILELKTSVLLTLVFAVLLCGAYPLVVWAGAQALFADKANGSLIVDKDGTVRGSTLLAQNFSSDKYFQPRASAAGTGYDATSSGGHQPRADEPEAERQHQGRRRGLPRVERPRRRCAGARRRRHLVRAAGWTRTSASPTR